MKSIHFFYRHPHPIYFSIEKLFQEITGSIREKERNLLDIEEFFFPYPSKPARLYKNISFVRNSQGSINHVTGDVHYGILGCNKRNINILTVHDCVMLYHYKSYDPRHWVIRWLWYILPAKRATAITVISENTRKDLIRFAGCPADKVRVIPDFVDTSYKPAPYIFKRDNPVILFIGTAPNKNLARLIEALSGMKARLEIIGFPDEQNKSALKASNISYSVFSVLSPEEMAERYRNADIIAFPSTYEGFGLPILEGQATGRPVLTSAVSPMKEVAGKGACLVDPLRVDDIRNGLVRIMEDADYRDHLIREGFKNVEQYRLEKVAKQYTDLYKELLSNNPVN